MSPNDSTGNTNDSTNQPSTPKRFKFAPRQPVASVSDVSAGPDNELRIYLSDLKSLTEDTDVVTYWVGKESQYKCIGGLALDLVAASFSSIC